MSRTRSWHRLPGTHPEVPDLLVSAAFSESAYTVHVTDLSNIWSESLDRRAICLRALQEETTIDPTNGADQMGVFLGKVRSALDPSSDEHDDASLSLSTTPIPNYDGGGYDLVLHIDCRLPGGLKPLKWPMNLKRSPPSTLTSELVLPLIQQHHLQQQQIGQLTSKLKEKDAVISRMLDKLEAAGMGLDHIFTVLSSKRKISRAVANERVKGLAPFNESEFRARLAAADEDSEPRQTFAALVSAVFDGDGLKYRSDSGGPSVQDPDGWCGRLGAVDAVPLVRLKSQQAPTPQTPPRPTKTDEDDDDFQVQATPPHRMSADKRSAPTKKHVAPDDDDETTDDEGHSMIPDSHPPAKLGIAGPPDAGKSTRIGLIGRNNKPPEEREEANRKTADKPMGDGGSETASDPDDQPRQSTPPRSGPAPRKGRLGRLGGNAAKSPTTEPAGSSSPAGRDDEGGTKSPPQRIGRIGRKPAHSEGTRAEADDRGRTPVKEETREKEKPRETSTERADRRRMDLQRDLDRKAAAGPAKKKRKF